MACLDMVAGYTNTSVPWLACIIHPLSPPTHPLLSTHHSSPCTPYLSPLHSSPSTLHRPPFTLHLHPPPPPTTHHRYPPHAPRPMPCTPCPVPHATCPMPHTPHRTHDTHHLHLCAQSDHLDLGRRLSSSHTQWRQCTRTSCTWTERYTERVCSLAARTAIRANPSTGMRPA